MFVEHSSIRLFNDVWDFINLLAQTFVLGVENIKSAVYKFEVALYLGSWIADR